MIPWSLPMASRAIAPGPVAQPACTPARPPASGPRLVLPAREDLPQQTTRRCCLFA